MCRHTTTVAETSTQQSTQQGSSYKGLPFFKMGSSNWKMGSSKS